MPAYVSDMQNKIINILFIIMLLSVKIVNM